MGRRRRWAPLEPLPCWPGGGSRAVGAVGVLVARGSAGEGLGAGRSPRGAGRGGGVRDVPAGAGGGAGVGAGGSIGCSGAGCGCSGRFVGGPWRRPSAWSAAGCDGGGPAGSVRVTGCRTRRGPWGFRGGPIEGATLAAAPRERNAGAERARSEPWCAIGAGAMASAGRTAPGIWPGSPAEAPRKDVGVERVLAHRKARMGMTIRTLGPRRPRAALAPARMACTRMRWRGREGRAAPARRRPGPPPSAITGKRPRSAPAGAPAHLPAKPPPPGDAGSVRWIAAHPGALPLSGGPRIPPWRRWPLPAPVIHRSPSPRSADRAQMAGVPCIGARRDAPVRRSWGYPAPDPSASAASWSRRQAPISRRLKAA